MALKCRYVPVTDLRDGDRVAIGTVVGSPVVSKSGKTLQVTVRTSDGGLFTDRLTVGNNCAVFWEE